MNLAERVESIEHIAVLLADAPARAVWDVESEPTVWKGKKIPPKIHLTVTAGGKTWTISATAEPREAGENLCANYLLHKMANAAGVCHKCRSPVRRKDNDPKTNKIPVRRYRCPTCLYSWTDS